MTTISIIIPTYNRRHLIGQAIESVLGQSWPDFELIIVDDGSIDATGEFITQNYTDTRIRYFYQQNRGQNFARNFGLSKACGEYICFLDSDDWWPANKLEISLAVFKEYPETDVVYGDEMVVNEEGNELYVEKIRHHSGKITAYLIAENFVGMCTTMVRANPVHRIGGMDESIRVADDYSLWLRLSSTCNFYYLNQILGYYRISREQISKNLLARLNSNLYIVNTFLENNPDILNRREKENSLGMFYCNRVRLCGRERMYYLGLLNFFMAVRYKPFSFLPWRALFRLIMPAAKR